MTCLLLPTYNHFLCPKSLLPLFIFFQSLLHRKEQFNKSVDSEPLSIQVVIPLSSAFDAVISSRMDLSGLLIIFWRNPQIQSTWFCVHCSVQFTDGIGTELSCLTISAHLSFILLSSITQISVSAWDAKVRILQWNWEYPQEILFVSSVLSRCPYIYIYTQPCVCKVFIAFISTSLSIFVLPKLWQHLF